MVQQNTQPYFLYNAGPYNDPRTQHQNREYRDRSPSLYDMIPNEQNSVSDHPILRLLDISKFQLVRSLME